MAKNNIFLGFGRGKLGDIVMYRSLGEQITRARNRSPKNPRTPLQLCQRVLIRTASQAYSVFSPISDHAFQGFEKGTPCQSQFMRLNVAQMRDQINVAGGYDDPSDLPNSELVNFAAKNTTGAVFRRWIISDGTMPSLVPGNNSDGSAPHVVWQTPPSAAIGVITYAELAAALGLEVGDQVTFVWVFSDLSYETNEIVITDMRYARIILLPESGDASQVAFASAGQGSDYYVMADPNSKNQGTLYMNFFGSGASGGLSGYPSAGGVADVDRATHTFVGFCAIASRKVGNVWQRSRGEILLRAKTNILDYDEYELGDAIRSYMTAQDSGLYLNQAENF